MATKTLEQLSRRQRQIVEIILKRGRANAHQVVEELPNPPSYTAVRGTLRHLEEKGFLRHEHDGPRYVYVPTISPNRARAAAIRHLVHTFFNGSVASAVGATLEVLEDRLDDVDLDALQQVVDNARKNAGRRQRSRSSVGIL